MPWCEVPSSPTSPARSTASSTGRSFWHTAWTIWSKARCRNVEYSATTGRMPPIASPEAIVTACCSAMPTSWNRCGYAAWNLARPVPVGMPAVIATIRLSSLARSISSFTKTDVVPRNDADVGDSEILEQLAWACEVDHRSPQPLAPHHDPAAHDGNGAPEPIPRGLARLPRTGQLDLRQVRREGSDRRADRHLVVV